MAAMELYHLGLASVAGAATTAAALTAVVHRLRRGGPEHGNEAVGQVFTLVAGLHAVLMAFVLIGLFDAASTARARSYREASSLVAVSWAGESLPEPARGRIQELSRTYANTVVEQEWPRMRAGQDIGDDGGDQLDRLLLAIEHADAPDEWQRERKIEAANRLWEVYLARQDRMHAAGQGVSLVMWFALIVGSLMSVCLPYLFGGMRLGTHAVLIATVAASITLLLFTIHHLQNPFSGGARVDPDAFRTALDRLG